MSRGFSLPELVIRLVLMGLLAGLAVPRLAGMLDWLAVARATQQVTTVLAIGRHTAIQHAARTRVVIALDALRLDRWGAAGWETLARWPGPRDDGVALSVSNPEVVFGATGVGYGASNTKIVLQRGSHSETVTVSRLGRVKRW